MTRTYILVIFILILTLSFFAFLGILLVTGYNHETNDAYFSDFDIMMAIVLPIFALIGPLILALKKKK